MRFNCFVPALCSIRSEVRNREWPNFFPTDESWTEKSENLLLREGIGKEEVGHSQLEESKEGREGSVENFRILRKMGCGGVRGRITKPKSDKHVKTNQ